MNGSVSISGVNTLSVGTGATSLGGTLGVAGLTTLSGGANVTGNVSVTGNVAISGTTTLGSALTVNAGTGIAGTFSGRVVGGDAINNDEFTTKSQVTSIAAVAVSGAAGNYIANGTTQQASANFNIGGSGVIGTTLGVGGNFTNNGYATFRNAADSTASFRVQNAAGTSDVFTVDTQFGNISTTGRLYASGNNIALGNAGPGGQNALLLNNDTNLYRLSAGVLKTDGALTVAGGISSTGVLAVSAGTGIVGNFSGRVAGGDAVANNEFSTLQQVNAAVSGAAGNYIANSTSLQSGGNFNIDGSGTVGSLSVANSATIGGSIKLTGIAGFPASPTEGQITYNTTTKQLYIFANGKWQADRSAATLIVAASNSQNKEKADFVATGTNDESQINAAIAALPASGGHIVLLDGTFNVGSSIVLSKANVKITGAGSATVLKRMYNSAAISDAVIRIAATYQSLSSFKIDGNKAAFSNANNDSIYFVSTATSRNNISELIIIDSAGDGMRIDNFQGLNRIINNEVSNSTGGGIVADDHDTGSSYIGNLVYSNGGIGLSSGNAGSATNNIAYSNGGTGILINGNSSATGNTSYSNTGAGIAVTYNVTASGNNSYSNGTYGIDAVGADKTTIIGNHVASNGNHGIYIKWGSSTYNSVIGNSVLGNAGSGIVNGGVNTTISGNTISDNGGTGGLSAIYDADNGQGNNARITNNVITDTAGTGYAIQIPAGVSGVYLSGNTYSGTGAASINDAGTGTTYTNQQDATGKILFRGTAGLNINSATTADATAQLLLGTGAAGNKGLTIQGVAAQTGDLLQLQNSSGTNLVTVGATGNIVTGGTLQVNATSLFQGATRVTLDSANAFYVDNLASNRIFNVDTVNRSVGINTNDSSASLVAQTSAAKVGGIFRGGVSQTADLLQLQKSDGTVLSKFDANGALTITNATGASIAGINIFDTTGAKDIGTSTGALRLQTYSTAGVQVFNGLGVTGSSSAIAAQAGNGTSAGYNLTVSGSKGGNTTGTTGQTGGTGSYATILGGDGGDAPAGSTNGPGGSIILQGGAPGAGAGTAGSYGSVNFQATGGNVGIGTSGPAYKLDVQGGTGIVGQFSGRVIGGNAVANNEFATLGQVTGAVSGAASGYIANGTGLQTSANFNIQSAAAGSIGGIIRGAVSQTADLMQLQDSGGAVVASIAPNGSYNARQEGSVFGSAGGTPTGNFSLGVNAVGPTTTALILKGVASQSADLLQIQKSDGTVLSKFDSTGNLSVTSNGTNTGQVTIGGGLQLSNAGAAARIANLNTGSIGHLSIDAGGTGSIKLNSGTNSGTGGIQLNSGGASPTQVLVIDNTGKIAFGASSDTNLYRSAATTLKTDSSLIVGTLGSSATTLLCVDGSNKLSTCTSGGSGGGSTGAFIANGTSLQTSANFNIQSATAGSIGGIIKGAASQSADLLQLQTSSGAAQSGFSANGSLYVAVSNKNNAGITTAGVVAGQTLALSDGYGAGVTLTGGTGAGPVLTVEESKPFIIATQNTAGSAAVSRVQYGFGDVATNTYDNAINKFNTASATTVGVIVQAAASQTANLLQLQDSTGVSRASFGADGSLKIGNNAMSWGPNLDLQSRTSSYAFSVNNGNTGAGIISGLGTAGGATDAGTAILGPNNIATGTVALKITANRPDGSGVVQIQGAASQTADLLQVLDSTGAILNKISSNGDLYFGNAGGAGSVRLAVSGGNRDILTLTSPGGLIVTANTTAITSATTIKSGNTTYTPLSVQAETGQVADLLQIKNSVGTTLSSFTSTGALQGGLASGSNAAGTNLTLNGGQGTGNANGGNIVFQYAPAGGSGSTANTLQTACFISGTNGSFSCPGSGNGSERFGAGSSVGANNFSLAVGGSSVASNSSTTALGNGASASGLSALALGQAATASGSSTTALGTYSVASANNSVAIGTSASATGVGGAVALGDAASASNNGSIAIGGGSSSAFGASIALGKNAATTAANQLVISSIQNVIIGNGVTNAAPTGFTLQATGGSGSNIAGASVSIAGGQGTGTGVGGGLNFQIAKPGSTGSSLNSLSTVASINGTTGAALFQNVTDTTTAFQIQNATASNTLFHADTTNNRLYVGDATGTDTNTTLLVLDSATADPTTNVVNGAQYYNTTSGKFRCYESGAWKNCVNTGGGDAYLANDQTFTGRNTFTGSGNGTTTSGALFQNTTNSATAFQIQNAAGTSNLLVADTSNTRIGIGAAPANSLLTVGTNTTTAAGGISLGTDTGIYRSAAGNVSIRGGTGGGSGTNILSVVRASDNAELFTVNDQSNVNANSYYASNIVSASNGGASQVLIGASTLQYAQGEISLTRTGAGELTLASGGAVTKTQLIIKGTASQTADYFDVQNSSATNLLRVDNTGNLISGGHIGASYDIHARQGFAGQVDIGGEGPSSEAGIKFGLAGDTNLYRSAAGTLKTDGNLTVVGTLSSPGAGANSERFGAGTTAAGAAAVAIGVNASASGSQAIAIGANSVAGPSESIAIGRQTSAGFAGSIALGSLAVTTATNQLVIGGNGSTISNAFIGNGVTNTAPAAFTLQGTGGSGTDIAGASVTIAGGQGTGTGAGGGLNFQIAKPGTTGSTLNGLSTVASLNGTNGAATFQNATDSTTGFKVQNAAGNSLFTVDTTGAGVSVGNAGLAGTLQFGNTTGAVAQTINIGNNATASSTTNVLIGSTVAGSTTIQNAATIGLNAGVIVGNVTSQDLFNTVATTINFGGAATTLNIGPGAATATSINIAGGSGATGCTINGANGNLTCSGSVTSTATSGTFGYLSRSGTTLSPATAGDAITTSGNLSTSGTGTVTSAGLLTGSAGLTVSGAATSLSGGAVNINASSSFAVNVGTGSTTGGVSVGNTTAAQTVLIQGGTSASAVSIQTGAAGTLSLGNNGVASTVQVGNTTGAVAQTINIGNNSTASSSTNVLVGSTVAGTTTIQNAATIGLNAGVVVGNATSQDLFNTVATTINFGGAASTLNVGPAGATATSINIAGGSGATGCTIDGATGNLTCSGNIAGNATGTVGYFSRSGTTVTTATAGDAITTSGNISTSGSGTVTSAGLLTASAGLTVSGAATSISGGAINLNASSNFAVNVGTGTTTGGVSVGNTTATQTVLIQGGTSASAVSIQSGTGSTISVGSSGVANTLQVGNTTGAVAQTINIGNNATASSTTNVLIGSTVAGSTTIQNAATIGLNAGVVVGNATSQDLFNTVATTINFGGAATTLNIGPGAATATSINIAGGSAATGCTINGANGNLTCSGSVTSTATSGTFGYFGRSGTTLSPATAGDNITTSGALSTTGTGTVTSAGLLTGSAGLTVSGAATSISGGAINLNDSSNFAVNAGTGTSTGGVSIGNTTAAQTVLVQGGTSASAVSIQSGTGSTISIGSNGAANTLQVGNTTGAVAQTINIGNNATASSTTNVLIGSTVAGTTTIQNAATISLNAGTVVGNATTQNLFNTVATSINFGGAATTLNIGPGAATATSINIAGGSAATGCTIDGATGNLTCSGNIAGNATGTVGYFSRSGTTVSTATAGDAITTSGNISTSGTGTVTSAGLLTGSAGLTVNGAATSISGGAINLNASSNFAVNVATGTTTGGLNLGNTTAAQTVLIQGGTSASAVSIQTGAAGTLSLGDNGAASTVQVGNTTGAVAQTINIGNNSTASSTTNVLVGSTVAGTTTIQNAATISLNAGTVVGNVTTQNLFNTVATTINFGGAASNLNVGPAGAAAASINIAGGSAATGCTIDGATGNLVCSGNITGNATGTVGYFSRSGTTVSTATAGDAITTSGNLSTTGTGTVTSAGLLTGSAGLTVSGAGTSISGGAINLNASSNFAVNVGTGTTTGGVSVGNTTAAQTVLIQGGTSASAVSIQTGAAGTLSLGNNGVASTIQVGNTTGAVAQTINIGNNATAASSTAVNIGSTIAGAVTLQSASSISLNAPTIDSNAASVALLGTPTTINFGAAAATFNIGPGAATAATINIAGGSGATGCTVDGATGNLTCSGNISGNATGTVGYFSRSGTTLSPATAGDAITTSGNISTSGTGTVTSAGLLTGSAGLTASGAAINLNASSSFAVNVGTGTTTGGVNVGNTTAAQTVLIQGGTSASAVSIQTGAAGTLSIGDNGVASTVQVGNTTGAVAQTINIGNNATASSTTNVLVGSTVAGTTTIQNAATISLNAGTVVGNATTQNLFNTVATTINFGGAATTLNIGPGAATAASINIAGGSAATGCTIDGATGSLTCSGNISGNATGTVGYFSRSGTTVSTATAGDAITTSGNVSTSGTGTITSAGLLTGSAGLTVSGAGTSISGGAINLNASSSFAVNVGTGTTTGGVSVGNTTAAQTVLIQGGTSATAVSIQTGSAGTLSLGNNGVASTIQVGNTTGAVAQTINIGNNATAASSTAVVIGSTIAGAVTLQSASSISLNAPTIDSNAATVALLGTPTTINFGAAAGTFNIGPGAATAATINIAGGNGATGCTIDGATGNLVCSGNITGNATGTVGYFSRSGTTVSTATAGDAITTSGNISTSGTGTVTSAGLLTGLAGLTVSGAATSISGGAINLNASSSFAVNVATGTTTGGLNLGNTTAAQTVLIQGGTSATAVSIQTGASGTLSLGNNGLASAIQIGNTTGAVAQTINIGNNATAASSTTVIVGSTVAGTVTLQSASSISLNAPTIDSTAATVALFGSPTTINLGAAAGTFNIGPGAATAATINIAGGSGATGCTIDGATGGFSCTGNITGNASGTVGFFSRAGTTISTATAGDAITTSGNISTSGTGTVTSAGLLTGSAGVTVSGGPISLTATTTASLFSGSGALTLQGGTASGTNIAGTNLVLNGGQGTGTGVGGNINLQIAKAGSSGAVANAVATVASISGTNGAVLFKNSADNTTAFQIQNATATTTLLAADTTNAKLSITGFAQYNGGMTVAALSIPAAPTVTPTGTTGATSYSYVVTARTANAGETPASAAGSTAAGNATLTGGNFNAISWTAIAGAKDYRIYRTVGGGTLGLIGTVTTTTLNDTGLAATTAAPTTDSSETLTAGAALFKNSTNTTTAFQIQNATGTGIVVADTSNNRLQVGDVTADGTGTLLVLDTKNTAADPTGVNGGMYYNSSLGAFRCYEASAWKNCLNGIANSFASVPGATAATAAKAAAGTILITPIYVSGQITVNEMRVNVTTLLGATGDVGIYNSAGTLVLNGGSGTVSAAVGLKTIAPVQAGANRILEPGQYYVAVTWNSTTGIIAGANVTTAGTLKRAGTIAGGGAVLPASITLASIADGTFMYAVSIDN
ncbi:MAG: hypothetical protein QFB87_05265 [Patescibacteria group bacterium]|nr:hypothetical protein [Patescibacteria group bacterium]